MFISERIRDCGSWWRGATERERFLLYYTCLRVHYALPAGEALIAAKAAWRSFGPEGDLIAIARALGGYTDGQKTEITTRKM